jgi:hypothetical protein
MLYITFDSYHLNQALTWTRPENYLRCGASGRIGSSLEGQCRPLLSANWPLRLREGWQYGKK